MRNRIAAVAGGIVLAVAGLPATPALAAAGTTCVNLYTAGQSSPGNDDVIARACITWNDAPSGSSWTMSEQRVWNPPGGVNYQFFADLHDNAGRFNGSAVLNSGQTRVGNHSSVGALTAKTELDLYTYSSVPFCIYLVPGGSNIEHHAC